jgi:hypothetical protein
MSGRIRVPRWSVETSSLSLKEFDRIQNEFRQRRHLALESVFGSGHLEIVQRQGTIILRTDIIQVGEFQDTASRAAGGVKKRREFKTPLRSVFAANSRKMPACASIANTVPLGPTALASVTVKQPMLAPTSMAISPGARSRRSNSNSLSVQSVYRAINRDTKSSLLRTKTGRNGLRSVRRCSGCSRVLLWSPSHVGAGPVHTSYRRSRRSTH